MTADPSAPGGPPARPSGESLAAPSGPATEGLTVAPRRGRRLAALAAGLLMALGHPPFSALWAALPGLVLAFVVFDRSTDARRASYGLWWVGVGYFGLALSWIVQPFFVDPARDGWMAPFAIVLMAGGLALFWGAAGWLAFRLGNSARARRWALVAALTGAELVRSYVFTGFPWALIGHVWIGWPGMQLAAYIGPGGLTLAALAIAALAASLRPAGIVAALALVATVTGAGLWRQAQALPPDPGGVVRLVQPAIPQSLKWDPDEAAESVSNLLGLTAAAPGPLGPPDVTIWPETSFPYILDSGAPLLARAREMTGEGRLLIGAMRVEGDRVWNSLVEVGLDGTPLQTYDKHHLVPFGEYIPFGAVLSHIGLRAFTAQEGYGYTPGPGAALIDLEPLGRALPLICYEAIFPQDVRAAPERPDWLLQATNDAWFGTFQGPYQHLAQARLRAVETGLPMVRVANTGISAVIDAYGAPRAELALGKRGHIDASLPAALPATLYWRMGDLPLAVLLALWLAGLAVAARRRSD